MNLPSLYPIIDVHCFATAPEPVLAVARFAEELLRGGAKIIQLRDKSPDVRRFLSCARELRRVTSDRARLIINDRVDIALACDADGVHLGQDDVSPVSARRIFDSIQIGPEGRVPHPFARVPHPFAAKPQKSGEPSSERVGLERVGSETMERKIIGFSTHNLDQVSEANTFPIDYLAVGPVFATVSKANPDPVIGLEGVRAARQQTRLPLVAIGGITRNNCRQVREAGADAVAVISDLLQSPAKAVEDFLRVLE